MAAGKARRPVPRLHLISDRRLCPLGRFPEVARLAIAGGVDAVHLREKDLPGGALLDGAYRLQRAIDGRAALLINERVDVALIVAARGVQLGETAVSPREVRALCGERFLIGRSVHDAAGAERAAIEGADFVLAGHVYETRSKPGQPARGPEWVWAIARNCPLPLIAIGGITPRRAPEVVQAGAHGVAVISGILSAPDPAEAARAYRRALERGGVASDGGHGDSGQRQADAARRGGGADDQRIDRAARLEDGAGGG